MKNFAGKHTTREFFSAIKPVYGSSKSRCSPSLPSGGLSLIRDQEGPKTARLNNSQTYSIGSIDHDVLQQIPQLPILDASLV